jgi:hypothetical protein
MDQWPGTGEEALSVLARDFADASSRSARLVLPLFSGDAAKLEGANLLAARAYPALRSRWI